jgi:hypothetical protein
MAPKKQNKTSGKEGEGKIKSLKLKKQTVQDLSVEDSGKVKGGLQRETGWCTYTCEDSVCVCAAPAHK